MECIYSDTYIYIYTPYIYRCRYHIHSHIYTHINIIYIWDIYIYVICVYSLYVWSQAMEESDSDGQVASGIVGTPMENDRNTWEKYGKVRQDTGKKHISFLYIDIIYIYIYVYIYIYSI